MIFAAGKGTRLRPLTDTMPKALVTVGGISLLERAIRKLESDGFTDIIINVCHFAEQVVEFLHAHNNFGLNIAISDESDLLLDTGGGLRKASWFFDDKPFLVYNVDILTDLNLEQLYLHHLESESMATLAVRSRVTKRYLMTDASGRLTGWKNVQTGEIRTHVPENQEIQLKAFSGIHVINPEFFSHMPDEKVFPVMDLYINICNHQLINTYDHSSGFWTDVGKPEELAEAELKVNNLRI